MLESIQAPQAECEIALVGMYIKLTDAYKSIYEALTHGGIAHRARVVVRRVDAESIEAGGPAADLSGVRGVPGPGGCGERGSEGKIRAIRFARERRVPF